MTPAPLRYRLFVFAAPIALCVVAFAQRFLVHAYNLSDWKGGGFGMFSTPVGNRELTVTFIASDGVETRIRRRDLFALPLKSRHKDRMMALVTMPSAGYFRQCIRDIDTYDWIVLPRLDNERRTVPDAATSSAGDSDLNPAGDAAGAPDSALLAGAPGRPTETADQDPANRSAGAARFPLPRQHAPATRLSDAIEVAEIVIELWEYRFDGDRKHLILTQLASEKLTANR